MAFELIAAIALAFAAGGIAVLLRRLSSGRVPKIVVPLAAAFALIGFAIWGDYTWASRTISAFPERLLVVDEPARSDIWRPWSYVFPVRERIVAADTGSVRSNPDDADAVEVDLYFLERRQPTRKQTLSIDCAGLGEGMSAEPPTAYDLEQEVCASRR